MGERIHDVDVRTTVGDHHTLRSSRGSAGVVDGDEVSLVNLNALKVRTVIANRSLVIGECASRFGKFGLCPSCGRRRRRMATLLEQEAASADVNNALS